LRKLLCLFALAGGAAVAQQVDLAQTAQKAEADWKNLASGLEPKIARMLPCDPRVKAALEEVSRASEVRLAALGQYLQTELAEAKRDSETARAPSEAAQLGVRELEADRAEAEQERIAVEAQLADLTESVRRRPLLDDARQKLESIVGMTRQRASELQEQVTHRAALAAALAEVAAARQARERALEAQLAALALETSHWGDYYDARLARARTECAVTNPAGATRAAQKKKQQ
jgi:hypothetical protein